MSKTHKDLPAHIRDPETDYRFGTERIPYVGHGHDYYTGEPREYTAYWYKDIPGFKTKKKRHEHRTYWTQITPMWWIHVFMIEPQRIHGKEWERKVVKMAEEDLVDVDLPSVGRKPHHYYW